MIASWMYQEPPKYSVVKNQFFDKYDQKIKTMIYNIDSNSLKDEDKAKLKKRLVNKLLESI